MYYERWNRNKIREQLKYLQSLPSSKIDDKCLEDIEHLKLLLDKNNTFDCFDVSCSFREQMIDDANSMELYFDFLDDIEIFVDNASIIKKSHYCYVDSYKDIPVSTLFSFLKEFFHDFDSEFGKAFDRVYAEKRNNLRFNEERSIQLHIPTLQYSYISIEKTNTLHDFINAVHEYSHAIADLICYRDPYSTYPFAELVSMFMELVAADYMMDCYMNMDRDLNSIRINSCKDILIYADNINIEKTYFYAYDEIDDRRKVINGMKNICGKSTQYVSRILEKTAMEKLSYTIPYMTAVELYYLYLKDKKETIHILKHLMIVEREKNYNDELKKNGIYLNTHSADWADTLIKRKKKL